MESSDLFYNEKNIESSPQRSRRLRSFCEKFINKISENLHVLRALGEVVALAGMGALGLAAAGEPDPLLGGALRLHLGHFAILSEWRDASGRLGMPVVAPATPKAGVGRQGRTARWRKARFIAARFPQRNTRKLRRNRQQR